MTTDHQALAVKPGVLKDPYDALSDSWGIHEKRAADFFGRQPAHFAERERYLRIQRQGRMATDENQPQPIVLDVIFTRIRSVKGTCGNPLRKFRQ